MVVFLISKETEVSKLERIRCEDYRNLACGGGFFVFKKVQEKKKAQEAAKPDPDADYVDDNEDYGYDPEFEDDDADSSVDEDDNEPV